MTRTPRIVPSSRRYVLTQGVRSAMTRYAAAFGAVAVASLPVQAEPGAAQLRRRTPPSSTVTPSMWSMSAMTAGISPGRRGSQTTVRRCSTPASTMPLLTWSRHTRLSWSWAAWSTSSTSPRPTTIATWCRAWKGPSESELGWWIFGAREENDLKLELTYDDVWRIADVSQTLEDPSEPGVIETAFVDDDSGRVVAASSTDGEETTITYDDADRVTRIESSDGDGSVKKEYTYGDAAVGGLVLTPDMRHGRFFDLAEQSYGRMEAELEVLAVPALNDLVLAR